MTTKRAAEEGTMRVWAVTFKEFAGAEEIVHERDGEGFRPLMYADTAEGYNAALGAFRVVVNGRIGAGHAVYSFPGEIGSMARAHIIVRDSREDHDDCCDGGYTGDVVELRPYEVIGG